MSRAAFAIPEKIYFKIGEVCDLVGVQAHVLRYWETEFPMLAPQKNRAGQRTYRRRDVEIALRIKELLYEELYTIAGAKKKLSSEIRGNASEAPKLKIVSSEPHKNESTRILEKSENEFASPPTPQAFVSPQTTQSLAENIDQEEFNTDFDNDELSDERRSALHNLAQQLSEIRQILNSREEMPRSRW
ncbi:MAG: MerR family transcriptional regulator [Acidobacteriota bacterium]|nr:MerR family transcriptional regulator [Acidobacteriota bacterium]